MSTVEITLGSQCHTTIRYPAGELQVRLTDGVINQLNDAENVLVIARIANMEQLTEALLLWDAVGAAAPAEAMKYLVLPYLPFARADRRFADGDCFGLGVFARIINAFEAHVVSLDVHSEESRKQIQHLMDVSALPLIEAAASDFAGLTGAPEISILFPDEGARKRYRPPQKMAGTNVRVLHCSKKRNPITGKLVEFQVPDRGEFISGAKEPSPVLIVDDICDGGRTFNGIADAVKDYGLTIALYVTHGIFSKGTAALKERFEKIYTSDSFPGKESSADCTVLPALPLLRAAALAVNASQAAK